MHDHQTMGRSIHPTSYLLHRYPTHHVGYWIVVDYRLSSYSYESIAMDELKADGSEAFKASVHLGLFSLAITCLAYNAMSYGQRRETHLLRNAIAYGGLAVYEVLQMARHWNSGHDRSFSD